MNKLEKDLKTFFKKNKLSFFGNKIKFEELDSLKYVKIILYLEKISKKKINYSKIKKSDFSTFKKIINLVKK